MNRQKKIKQISKKLLKKENAKKAAKTNKPKYICKADRELLKAQELAAEQETSGQEPSQQAPSESD